MYLGSFLHSRSFGTSFGFFLLGLCRFGDLGLFRSKLLSFSSFSGGLLKEKHEADGAEGDDNPGGFIHRNELGEALAGRRGGLTTRGNGVVAVAAPRMTAGKSTKREPESLDGTVTTDGFLTVMRAGRLVATENLVDLRW